MVCSPRTASLTKNGEHRLLVKNDRQTVFPKIGENPAHAWEAWAQSLAPVRSQTPGSVNKKSLSEVMLKNDQNLFDRAANMVLVIVIYSFSQRI